MPISLNNDDHRYSTMLAENLGDSSPRHHAPSSSVQELPAIEYKDQIDANGCAEQNGGMGIFRFS